MKIAIWHNLPSGGGKRALYYHVNGLLERGHYVEAWCPPTSDLNYLPLSQKIKQNVVPLRRRQRQQGSDLLSPIWSYLDSIENLKAMDEHCKKCADEINRGGFDLLFANACLFYRVTSIARYVKVPTILYLQEPFREIYEALPKLPWLALDPLLRSRFFFGTWRLRRFVGNLFEVQAIRVQAREECRNAQAFDRILVNSLYSRESVLRAYGVDSKVCYLGVDTGLFRDMGFQRDDFVIGVGSFNKEKNIDFILRSLAKIHEPRPKLVWIGNVADDAYLAKLGQLARDLKVPFEPMIKIDDQELVRLLNRAKMMVYAPRLEPFGLAPLEANACGLPVVSVAEGGVRESVLDGVNGLLVEHDYEAFGIAVERVRHDELYWQRLTRQSRRLVEEKWSLETAIDRLETRFVEVLGQQSRSDRYDVARRGSN